MRHFTAFAGAFSQDMRREGPRKKCAGPQMPHKRHRRRNGTAAKPSDFAVQSAGFPLAKAVASLRQKRQKVGDRFSFSEGRHVTHRHPHIFGPVRAALAGGLRPCPGAPATARSRGLDRCERPSDPAAPARLRPPRLGPAIWRCRPTSGRPTAGCDASAGAGAGADDGHGATASRASSASAAAGGRAATRARC